MHVEATLCYIARKLITSSLKGSKDYRLCCSLAVQGFARSIFIALLQAASAISNSNLKFENLTLETKTTFMMAKQIGLHVHAILIICHA